MTHREASTIAMREIGLSDEWILEHHAKADAGMLEQFGPGALAETNQQVKLRPGQTERDYIDYLKRMAAVALVAKKLAPDEFAKLVANSKAKLLKKIQGN